MCVGIYQISLDRWAFRIRGSIDTQQNLQGSLEYNISSTYKVKYMLSPNTAVSPYFWIRNLALFLLNRMKGPLKAVNGNRGS